MGSAAVELVLIAPVLVAVVLIVVGLGRIALADQHVDAAAAAAARAASLRATGTGASAAAHAAAARSLADAGLECQHITVAVDISGYRPGGAVTVEVACTAGLADLALAGFPGHTTLTGAGAAPIENLRRVR